MAQREVFFRMFFVMQTVTATKQLISFMYRFKFLPLKPEIPSYRGFYSHVKKK